MPGVERGREKERERERKGERERETERERERERARERERTLAAADDHGAPGKLSCVAYCYSVLCIVYDRGVWVWCMLSNPVRR